MKLFGSTSRYKLIDHVLNCDSHIGYVRDMSRRLGIQIQSLRRVLEELEKLGVIKSQLEVRDSQLHKDFYRTGDIEFIVGNLRIRIDKK